MPASPALRLLRGAAALATVALFMFPLFWWGLAAVKPASAFYDKDAIVWFGFSPSLDNFRETLAGETSLFAGRRAIADSVIIALGAASLSLALALPAAFGLMRAGRGGGRMLLLWVLAQRILPPIAVLVPLVLIFHQWGLRDTRTGVILAHAAANLPFAILLLKSFLEDVPREVGEAAAIDGATAWQSFIRIQVPLIRGGIVACFILCAIFSWTEFVMALFLTSSIRVLPVQLSLLAGQGWGLTAALSTASLAPAFIFILLVQRHLARGLTMGLARDRS
jgi:multiple sugar transport system permease protein